jgi:hypothetical protein
MHIHITRPELRSLHERNDCTVCALSQTTGLPYAICHDIARRAGRKDGKGLCSAVLIEEAKRSNVVLEKLNVPFESILVEALPFFFPSGSHFVTVKRHALALIDGKIVDNGGLRHERMFVRRIYTLRSERVVNFAESLFD